MKFLVVDDSATMRRIVIRALGEAGHLDIVEADHGLSGLNKLEAGGIEFIITDWNMPTMSGLDFVKAVREKNADIPILMVTTNADSASVVEALKAGVNNYVVKPFTPQTLLEKINVMLED